MTFRELTFWIKFKKTLSVLIHIRQVFGMKLDVGKLKNGFLVKNGHKVVAAQFSSP